MHKNTKLIMTSVAFFSIGIVGFFVGAYAEKVDGTLVEDKNKLVLEKFNEKIDKLNRGQLAFFITEYSYCMNYEDHLKSIDFPISGVNEIKCLDRISSFLDEIE